MIYYFSGTGNSRFIAEGIAKKINDKLLSLTPLMKSSDEGVLLESDKPFVFVLPIYAWRVPRPVDEFIKKPHRAWCNLHFVVFTHLLWIDTAV